MTKRPFYRIGSKNVIKKEILNEFPADYENMNYVEPFFGSGAIYFYKEPSSIEIINDLDKDLMDAYKNIKRIKSIPRDFEKYYQLKTNEEITAFYKSKKTSDTPYIKFIKDVIRYCFTFSSKGSGKAYGAKPKNGHFVNKTFYIQDFQDRMKNTIITSQDYRKIIKKYDGLTTLFYFDPPYEKCSKLYINESMDFDELARICKTIKGLFILSLNYSDELVKIFNGFNIKMK